MKEALQIALIPVLWIVFWLGGTIGGAVLQAWLIDIGVVSDIDPPWIITTEPMGPHWILLHAQAHVSEPSKLPRAFPGTNVRLPQEV
jgi:hypothetical protein